MQVDDLQAPPGTLLARRLEMPTVQGKIILPHRYRNTTTSSEAVVVSVGAGVTGIHVGDHVLLSNSVGRSLFLGRRGEDRIFRVSVRQVMALMLQPGAVESSEQVPELIPDREVREYMDIHEGDPEGLR